MTTTGMKLDACSGLILPSQLIDEKASLKKVIDELVDNAVLSNQHIRENYFLSLHAKFIDDEFCISEPVISFRLPSFVSNSFVFWVSNIKGICELLWMVPAKKPGEKLKPQFNTKGVAYLQAKGAMPKSEG
jgi:hypothetical protein